MGDWILNPISHKLFSLVTQSHPWLVQVKTRSKHMIVTTGENLSPEKIRGVWLVKLETPSIYRGSGK